MHDIPVSLLLQICELLAILATACGVFVKLGRLLEQVAQTTSDVGELRVEIARLSEARATFAAMGDSTRARVEALERRVDRIEHQGGGHGGLGGKAVLS